METRSQLVRLNAHEEQLLRLQSDVAEIKSRLEMDRLEERAFREEMLKWITQREKLPSDNISAIFDSSGKSPFTLALGVLGEGGLDCRNTPPPPYDDEDEVAVLISESESVATKTPQILSSKLPSILPPSLPLMSLEAPSARTGCLIFHQGGMKEQFQSHYSLPLEGTHPDSWFVKAERSSTTWDYHGFLAVLILGIENKETTEHVVDQRDKPPPLPPPPPLPTMNDNFVLISGDNLMPISVEMGKSLPWVVKKKGLPDFYGFDLHGWIPKVNLYFNLNDSWFQVGFVLTAGMNSAYVRGYSGAVMVPLGWVGGVVGLILATSISPYANGLIAILHEFGGKRHLRYRDFAGFIYGPKAYSLTWILQYINLFMINVGYVIFAGQALKAVYVLFRDDNTMKPPYFIVMAGFACGLFAIFIPHLAALRIWLGFSTFFSLVYIVVAFALSIRDGIRAPLRDYGIPRSNINKVFTTIGACASLVFAFNTGMLSEIQAAGRQPVFGNMMKALYFQFTVGVVPLYAVAFMGYWAYGNDVSAYLLNSVSGPVWMNSLEDKTFWMAGVMIRIMNYWAQLSVYLNVLMGFRPKKGISGKWLI